MNQLAVVYWTGTGNTEAMANAIVESATQAGSTVTIFSSVDFSVENVADYSAIAFGCPSMGAEELEETEFAPMWAAVKDALAGKKIALFGSYGWGDGEWMRLWEAECDGLDLVGTCICADAPDDEAIAALQELAEKLVG